MIWLINNRINYFFKSLKKVYGLLNIYWRGFFFFIVSVCIFCVVFCRVFCGIFGLLSLGWKEGNRLLLLLLFFRIFSLEDWFFVIYVDIK